LLKLEPENPCQTARRADCLQIIPRSHNEGLQQHRIERGLVTMDAGDPHISPWHQDTGAFDKAADPHFVLTVWLPLEAQSAAMGSGPLANPHDPLHPAARALFIHADSVKTKGWALIAG